MPDVLHDDDPNATVTLPDGRVIRNYSADEYEASYAEGGPCNQIPEEVMAAAERSAAGWRAVAEKQWIEHPPEPAAPDAAPARVMAPVILDWHPSPFFTPGRRADQALAVHSVESNIVAGIAVSLADGWFAHDANTSAHKIFDPATRAQMVHLGDTAWALGNGNPITVSYEHAGRAAYSRAQWTTPAGLAMLKESARSAADDARIHNWPIRWLSVVQLARGERGFCTHNDCRLAFGGTTHTDPGPGFPYDLYLKFVQDWTNPPPSPKEWPDVAMTEPDKTAIAALIRVGTVQVIQHTDTRLAQIEKRTSAQISAIATAVGAIDGVDAAELQAALDKVVDEILAPEPPPPPAPATHRPE